MLARHDGNFEGVGSRVWGLSNRKIKDASHKSVMRVLIVIDVGLDHPVRCWSNNLIATPMRGAYSSVADDSKGQVPLTSSSWLTRQHTDNGRSPPLSLSLLSLTNANNAHTLGVS
eukprot:TRINITY_DN6328_c0_g1_i1.p1 TRINITY_DN6328_c0_g1~~TRINITY_DN6328_c0_g1_i1.p1  ORF type:complete len:115 (+),score=14.30 TRINITY_DN6328_c0_g1_i1:42-386(+)